MSIRRILILVVASVVVLLSAGFGRAADLRVPVRNTPADQSPAGQSPSNLIDPIGIAFQISNIASLAEVYPAVAFDTVRNEYLAVWFNDRASNDDIMGQRLTKNGQLIGEPFYVATGGATIDRRYARLAYNVRADQYLVVWEQQQTPIGYGIYACRVSGNGVVLDPTPFIIEDYGGSVYTPATPVVAYAYTSDKYLVVWIGPVNGSAPGSVYGQLALSNGQLSGSLITIVETDIGHVVGYVDLAYNSLSNEYLVVWQQLDPGANLTDIWGRRVTGDGLPLGVGAYYIAYYTKSTTKPAVAALPIPPDGQYLVVWEQNYNPGDRDIMGRLVASDGTPSPTDISISVTNIVDELQPDVVGNPERGSYLVSWTHVWASPLSFIGTRLVTPAGELAGPRVDLGGIVAANSRLAAGPTGDYMMVYHDIDYSFDWGTYGWLVGNRIYLPMMTK